VHTAVVSSTLKASSPAFFVAAGFGVFGAVEPDVGAVVGVDVAVGAEPDVGAAVEDVAGWVVASPSAGRSAAMLAQIVAADDFHTTRFLSCGHGSHGTVMKVMFAPRMLRML
jgi:hypothetical protein